MDGPRRSGVVEKRHGRRVARLTYEERRKRCDTIFIVGRTAVDRIVAEGVRAGKWRTFGVHGEAETDTSGGISFSSGTGRTRVVRRGRVAKVERVRVKGNDVVAVVAGIGLRLVLAGACERVIRRTGNRRKGRVDRGGEVCEAGGIAKAHVALTDEIARLAQIIITGAADDGGINLYREIRRKSGDENIQPAAQRAVVVRTCRRRVLHRERASRSGSIQKDRAGSGVDGDSADIVFHVSSEISALESRSAAGDRYARRKHVEKPAGICWLCAACSPREVRRDCVRADIQKAVGRGDL